MLSTLTLMAAMVAPAPVDATDFSHVFKKGDSTKFVIDLSGEMEEGGVTMKAEFDLEIVDVKADGKIKARFANISGVAEQAGQEIPLDGVPDLSTTLNSNGLPTDATFDGMETVLYVALMTMYLPNKPLDEGDEFKGEFDLGDVEFFTKGSYVGHEDIDGMTYSVLKMESEATPPGEEPGEILTKAFFNKKTKRLERTVSKLYIADGSLDIKVSVKK